MAISVFYLVFISILSFFAGRLMPYRWFSYDRFPYKSLPFEKDGRIYLKIHIKKWQNRVPDMSKILPGLIPPKSMRCCTPEMLPVMVKETCIAECIHWGNSLLSLACLWMWRSWWCAAMVLVYIFAGNIPFVLIQRYNRPRLVRLMKRMDSKQERVSK